MVDDPKGEAYYGGLVAAPIFSEAMGHALRLLNVLPDNPQTGPIITTAARAD
jgi:cell division protein FtsI (penicillin-binding protein 3)